MSEDLLFRRASGIIESKDEFLSKLADKNSIYHEISTEVKKITISKDKTNAVVKAIDFVKITNDGGYLEGYFTNLRFFKEFQENGDKYWVLTHWYNEEVR